MGRNIYPGNQSARAALFWVEWWKVVEKVEKVENKVEDDAFIAEAG